MLVMDRDGALCVGPLPVALRPYSQDDLADVVALLRDLPELYPDGDRWLAGRLADVLDGRARATVAVAGRLPVGITIETPKGEAQVKLSTLLVTPLARGRGVGSLLMSAADLRWRREGVRRVHVTADVERADGVERTVSRYGFARIAVETDRYGPGRSEAVFVRGS